VKYNVVFSYNAKAGSYEGVRTWTSFESKEAFEKWKKEMMPEDHDVIAEGVAEQEAVRICANTPVMSYARAAIGEATNPITGEVNLRQARERCGEIGIAITVNRR